MSDGVAQGDGLGPLFISLGLDELLTAVRDAMRDLKFDSTMLGQVVHAVGSKDGARAAKPQASDVWIGVSGIDELNIVHEVCLQRSECS